MKRKEKPLECLKYYQFITIPVCAVCNKLHKCKYYQRYYTENKEKVIEDIIGYVSKHKNKYEIGVWFMDKKNPEKKFLVLEQGKITGQVTKKEAEDMVLKNPKKCKDIMFLPASQVMVPMITIRLTTKKITDAQISKMIKSI